MKRIVLLLLFLVSIVPAAFAGSMDKAMLLKESGLAEDAKRELVEVIAGNGKQAPMAYDELAGILFSEGRIDRAVAVWERLIKAHPGSPEAMKAEARMSTLGEAVMELSGDMVDNSQALAYLEHGDFWSKDKGRAFVIDSSWLPKVEIACSWYDKAISGFPGTTAAEIAHAQKIRTLLGWEADNRYDKPKGAAGDFGKYMPRVLAAFSAFEKEFPEASSLQALRYQVAQAYWRQKDWANTRKWLNRITESGAADSFYVDLAKRRLEKVEY